MNQNSNNDSGNDFSSREMVKGNWQCAECGKEITELPFEPSEGRSIYCKDCWMKKRGDKLRNFTPRSAVKGNWQCAECGKEITELPFEPSEGRPIYCKDCWMKKRNES